MARCSEQADAVVSNLITNRVANDPAWQALCDKTPGLEYIPFTPSSPLYRVSLPEGWRFQCRDGISVVDATGTIHYNMPMGPITFTS